MTVGAGAKTISPKEYLDYAATLSKMPGNWQLPKQRLSVVGDVELSRHPEGANIRILPEAEISGDLRAQNCPGLEVVECSAGGMVNLNGSGVVRFDAVKGVAGVLNTAHCESLRVLKGHFGSHVNLVGSGVVGLGRDFSCEGDLLLDRCGELESLGCRVGGDVSAEQSGIRKLERSFSCGGDMKLFHCRRLERLEGLGTPPRDVYLSGSSVVEVDPSFRCNGALILRNVDKLAKLSGEADNVDVEGAPALTEVASLRTHSDLSLCGCEKLETVDFSAGGHAKFTGCDMKTLSPLSTAQELTIRECPNLLSLGGKWGADVNLLALPALSQTNPDFRCPGSLLIRSCHKFERLQGRVGGVVTLSQTGNLRELTEELFVEGNLVLACPDLNIRTIACRVGGDLIVMGCRSEFSTAPGMRVEGSVLFHECAGLRTMAGWVGEKVSVREGCGLRSIGADFECRGDLLLSDCPELRVLNCRVGGDVVVKSSRLEKTGPAFACEGSLSIFSVSGLRAIFGSVGESCNIPLPELLNSGVTVRLTKHDASSTAIPTTPLPTPTIGTGPGGAGAVSRRAGKTP